MRVMDHLLSREEPFRGERAQTVVEYSLLLLLIVLGAVGGLSLFSAGTQSLWGRIMANVATAI